MTSPYSTNFIRTDQGNGIKQGQSLKVTIDGADWAQSAIYKDGMPINTDFDDNRDGKVVCEFKLLNRIVDRSGAIRIQYVPYQTGEYVLKTRAWINNRMQGWDDKFVVVE